LSGYGNNLGRRKLYMQGIQINKLPGIIAILSLVSFGPSVLQAQSPPAPIGSETGLTASELFSGSSNSVNGMLSFDQSVGWNFSKNFGVDVGVPYFLDTRPGLFESTTGYQGYVQYPYVGCTFFFGCYYGVANSPRMWAGELGDVYLDVHYTRPYRQYNLATILTGDMPTASFRKGLSTGRAQWDWFNHVDTDVHGFSPFVNFGLANGRMDQHFLPRPFNTNLPFRTLGYMADFEGGVQYKVWRRFDVGFSLWDVLPMGPQKIYSELVWQGVAPSAGFNAASGLPAVYGYLAGSPNHGRYWNSQFETTGSSVIDRDNGYSATLAFSPQKNVDVQVGYNHSVRYGLDEVKFTVGFNFNSLMRKLTKF
jgi:hypothetical protein